MKTKITSLVVMLSACLLTSPHIFAQQTSDVPIGLDLDHSNLSGVLFGLTESGGQLDAGTLYSYDTRSGVHKILIDFEPRETGSEPQGKLLESKDCLLYGTTRKGGLNNQGVLFSFDPIDGKFNARHDFHSHQGSFPEGALIQTKGGRIYGVTQRGGIFDKGILFEFDPERNAFKKRYDFKGAVGIYPTGGLMLGTDGMVYGLTATGGDFNGGCIYRFLPDVAEIHIEEVYHFDQATLGRSGHKPVGLLLQARDGMLYGLTSAGGAFGKGTLYALDPNKKNITVLSHFGTKQLGAYPAAGLSELNNGWLCGTTTKGGKYEDGVLFIFDPVREFFVFQFNLQQEKFGSHPSSALLLASDGYLYGIANNRSKEFEDAQLFKISPKGLLEFNTLVNFKNGKGKNPASGLIEYRKCHISEEKVKPQAQVIVSPNPSNGEAELLFIDKPIPIRIILRTPYGRVITDQIAENNKNFALHAKGAVGLIYIEITYLDGSVEVLRWIVH